MGGGGFAEIYSSGDIVLQNPVESCTIFIFVIMLSAALELLLHHLSHIENKYFRVVFEALSEEVMIVGVLALLLLFGSSVVSGMPDRWVTIFNWAHMCLFFMAVFFTGIVISIITSVQRQAKRWKIFEETRLDDARVTKDENRYRMATEHYRDTLAYLGMKGMEDVDFADYIAKMQRHSVVEITDLSWKSWAGLSILVI
eukprot:PhF_6_TR27135/c0_g1_i3/m.39599